MTSPGYPSKQGAWLFANVLLPTLAALAVLWSACVVWRFRRRLRKEVRLTARDRSMAQIRTMKPEPGRKLHEEHPGLPAVSVVRRPRYYRSISGTKARWWTAGADIPATHQVGISMPESYKNQVLFDPTAWNILRHRPESCVIVDVKRDLLPKFAPRLGKDQFAYDLTGLGPTSGPNLVENAEMAAITAAALYPIEGAHNPIFPQGARDLFEGLAEALGHARTSAGEVFDRLLGGPERIDELAGRSGRLSALMGGENPKLIGDFVTSARLPLTALNRPEVRRVFAPPPGAAQPLFRRKEAVWISIPPRDGSLALLAGALAHNMFARATASKRGTYFLMDEAGSCVTPENLARYLGVGRGEGAYFFLVLQDVSQLEAALGPADARSVLGNARSKFFDPTQDTATARYLSELSGQVTVEMAHFEHEGFERGWRQLFSSSGAPYGLRTIARPGILTEHLYGMVPGWFYHHGGDPHRVKLLILPPMFEWEDEVLPEPGALELVGASGPQTAGPSPAPGQTAPRPAPTDGLATDDAAKPRLRPAHAARQGPDNGRRNCPSCGAAIVSDAARFSECCGARL